MEGDTIMPNPVASKIKRAFLVKPGDKFNRWTVIGEPFRGTENNHLFAECQCECGTVGVKRLIGLIRGDSRSCGCVLVEWIKTTKTTHGKSNSSEFIIWKGMRSRCANKRNTDYKDYGGRGIYVCDRWLHSFANFYADMGARPTSKHSIERKDNNGPYSPENCKWATLDEQALNRRDNRLITFCGRTQTLSEWSRETGINLGTIHSRLKRGWSVERSLTLKENASLRLITINDKTHSLAEWSRITSLNSLTISKRIKRGLVGAAIIKPAYT